MKVPHSPTELFSETQGRALVAVDRGHVDALLRLAEESSLEAVEIGDVGGEELRIETAGDGLRATVAELRALWSSALPRALEAS